MDWDGKRLRVARARVRGGIADTRISEVRRVIVGPRPKALLEAHEGSGWLLTTNSGHP